MPLRGRPASMGGGPPGVNQTLPMAQSFLLVDAHNVIFARPDLARLQRRRPEAAREKLVQLLQGLQDTGETRVVAVFDGGSKAKPDTQTLGTGGVQVFYSRSADEVIERLVAKYSATHRLTVATDDNLIRTAAIAAGAATMSVEQLFDEIDKSQKEVGQVLAKLRRT